MLYTCAGVPLLAVFYVYKTKKFPPVVLCVGLLLLCASLARPQTVLMAPLREATVMLVMDTSGSMRAKDIKPSRIEAAQQAAQQFIQDKPSRLRVGLVTVAGTAALAQGSGGGGDVQSARGCRLVSAGRYRAGRDVSRGAVWTCGRADRGEG